MIRCTYDDQVDAGYVYFRRIRDGEVARTLVIPVPVGSVHLDIAANGEVLGLEILDVSMVAPWLKDAAKLFPAVPKF